MSGEAGDRRRCSVPGCEVIAGYLGLDRKWCQQDGKYYCRDCWDMRIQIARDGVVVHLETELLNGGNEG